MAYIRSNLFITGLLAINQLAVFGSLLIFARVIGAEDFSKIGITRTILLTLTILAPLGLDLSLLRFASVVRIETFLTAIRKLRLIACGLSLLALIVTVSFGQWLETDVYHLPGLQSALLSGILALPALADSAILGALYRARHQHIRYAAIIYPIPSALRIIATILCVTQFPQVDAYLLAMSIITIATWLVISIDNAKSFSAGSIAGGQAPAPTLPSVIAASLPMALTLFLYGLTRSLDVLLLGVFVDAATVGSYVALATLSSIMAMYAVASSQTLGPDVARAHHNGNIGSLERAIRGYIEQASIFGAYFYGGLAIFAPSFGNLLGQSFVFPQLVCLLLPLAYLVSAILAPAGYALSMTNRQNAELVIVSVGALWMLASCLLAVSLWGAVGAALAAVVSMLATNAVRLWYASKIYNIQLITAHTLIPTVLALILAALSNEIAYALATNSVVMTFGIGCVIYTGLFWLVFHRYIRRK